MLDKEQGKTIDDRRSGLLLGLFLLSLISFLLVKIIPAHEAKTLKEEMIFASQIMSESLEILRECQEEKGLDLDPEADVNLTGMIGVKSSPITTTLGNLAAKRTSANPNLAGLVVYLLRRAGVHSGDTIAVGASGSFPGLLLAVISAAKTMDVYPLVIASLGASQWGANRPEFNMLHMLACLRERGMFTFQPTALSTGGDQDTGRDLPEEGRALLTKDMQASGLPVISEGDLKENVEARMKLYFQRASGNPIKTFVNIGGSWSNLGIDSAILHLKPGLAEITRFPPDERQGILYAMASLDIPVIHLLYVKGLVQRYGLPWDPVPLPRPGEGDLYLMILENQKSFMYISVLYLVAFGVLLVFGIKKTT
jgi:poly-gamma-glutamate system protein